MFELAFFIIPSFFTYLGYIHGRRRKQINIFSQWVFLPILFIYSYVSFIIYYFLTRGLLGDLKCRYLTISQITKCIDRMSLMDLFLVCVTAYLLGRFLKIIKLIKYLKVFDLFHQIEPVSETQKIIDKTLNKFPLMIFLNNGNVHIGIPTSYDTQHNGIQCLDCKLIFSGHKKDGKISYHTNYIKAPEKVKRLFYLKDIVSIGEFNYKAFVYFLDQKSDKNQMEKDIIRQINI